METKIADNFIYESVLDKSVGDSNKTPFIRKNLNYILDQQAGNSTYTSGQVIIDSSSLASSGNTFQDWTNAYVVIPFNVKVEATALIASAAGGPTATTLGAINYLTCLKNNALIDSITVEQGGRTIINQTSNLSQLVNYKMHSTFSQDMVNKMGPSLMYYPDSVGAYTYNLNTNDSVNNTINDENNSASYGKPETHNEGIVKRQQYTYPYTTGLTTQALQKNEMSAYNSATAEVDTSAANVVFSDLHMLATIRLKDLADYFDKHPKLTRGVGYKIYLRVNQGVSTFTHSQTTSSVNPFSELLVSNQTFNGIGSSLTQPSMISVGLNKLSTKITYSNNVVISAHTLKLTSQIDTGANALINGVRLYVPSYECSPSYHEKLVAQPPLNRPFFDIYSNILQNQGAGAYVNTQIASGISSPKALIVIPQLAQATQSTNSQGSALNPSPGTTDPQLSLTNTQIKLGSEYVLPDRVNYDFIQFLENTSQMFGLNGNQTNEMSSGVIDFQKFKHNYRYYSYDLSRYLDSANKIPQMITFESFNNSNVAMDLYFYVLYERDATFSLAQGSVEVE